jgi:DNA-binding XRE family transcriptional regulator
MVSVDIAERFGVNLRCARKAAGMSQETVAIRASVHRTEVGMLERGERLPHIDTALKMAGAVDASLADLVDGIAWTPGKVKPGQFEPPGGIPCDHA